MSTNEIFDPADKLSLAVTHPMSPVSGDPVRAGTITGIAETSEDAAGDTTVQIGLVVYDMSVKAVNDSGNSAIAKYDDIFYVDADTPPLSKKASGYFWGKALEAVSSGSTDTIRVLHMPAGSAAPFGTSSLSDDAVTAAKLTDTLATGFIPLDIGSLRIIAANVIGNTSEGMLLDGNTAPSFQRVNGATDKALRVIWAASSSVEVQFPPVPKPPDLDGTANLEVHLMVGKDTNTDNTVTVDVQMFDGVGDTEAGNATAAIATAALTEYSAVIAAADLADPPGFLNISLVPGAHTTDAIWLYAAWIEYTRK
jgi:hypothetical protein